MNLASHRLHVPKVKIPKRTTKLMLSPTKICQTTREFLSQVFDVAVYRDKKITTRQLIVAA